MNEGADSRSSMNLNLRFIEEKSYLRDECLKEVFTSSCVGAGSSLESNLRRKFGPCRRLQSGCSVRDIPGKQHLFGNPLGSNPCGCRSSVYLMTPRIRKPSRDPEHNKRWPVVCFRMYSSEAHEALKTRAEEGRTTVSDLLRTWVAERLQPEVYK